MTDEIWKDISDFEDHYQVSNLGRVRSLDRLVKCSRGKNYRMWRGKVLKQTIAATRGYYQVTLSKKGKYFKKYVHRLVAETFILSKNETVNHKDGNKLNNRVENLEWATYSYNNSHAFKLGLKRPSGGRK